MKKIKVGNRVEMPEPNDSDIWNFGGFIATVEDILDNGNLVVVDSDGDFFEIEADRVELGF